MSYHRRLLTYSKRYLAAAEDLSKAGGEGWRFPVPHYLAFHAFELALKASLSERGCTEKALIALGHDVEKVLKQVDTPVSALLTANERIYVDWLNRVYRAKDFEYPRHLEHHHNELTIYRVPPARSVLRMVSKVVTHLDAQFRSDARKALRK